MRNNNRFNKILFLAILLLGLFSGIILVQQKQLIDKRADVLQCRDIEDQSACGNIQGCSWNSCSNFSPTNCESGSQYQCHTVSCTSAQCDSGNQACRWIAAQCKSEFFANAKACGSLTTSDSCRSKSSSLGCYWVERSCVGQRCIINVEYEGQIADGVCTGSTRICNASEKRCPVYEDDSFYEQCSADGRTWTRVGCGTGYRCDSTSPTYCSPVNCIPYCGSERGTYYVCNPNGGFTLARCGKTEVCIEDPHTGAHCQEGP